MTFDRTAICAACLCLAAGDALASGTADLSLDSTAAYGAGVLADASGRDSFVAQDDAFKPRVFGKLQFRYDLNSSDGYTFSGEDFTSGFSLRRTRLGVRGSIHERVHYKVEGGFDTDGGEFTLFDAYADIDLNDRWSLRAGQFKLPYLREFGVGSGYLLASERSVMESFFGSGRGQGVQLMYAADRVRAAVAFSDGFATDDTPFDDADEADYALTGRLEFLGDGTWEQFDDFTSWRGSDRGWMVGGAVHWQDGGDTGAVGGTTDDTEILAATADLSVEGDGWNLYGAFVWQTMDGAGGDFDDMGALVQGGIFVTDIVEVFGRWSVVLADSDRPADDDFHEFTVGVNYYLIEQSHAAKLTFDLGYFPEGQSGSPVTPSTATGVLASDDEQFNLRAQLQVLF